jgi:long-chain acyl-CoA synthetase
MLDLILDNANRRFPTKIALICEEKSYTYGELRELTNILAASLLERGIKPGDRVAFLLSNQLSIVLCYYACFKIGAVAVPLNIHFESELLKYAITHSGARVLITEAELFAGIEPIRSFLKDVEQFYLTSRTSEFNEVRPFDELLQPTPGSELFSENSERSSAAIYYTSGTTGLPKAVIHTQGSLTRAAEMQVAQIAISSEDTTLIMFPVCYLIGFGSQILPFHTVGATCVLLPRFEPRQVLEAIQTYKPTKTYGFPKLYNDLLNCPEASRYNLQSLKFCFSAGEAIPVAVQKRFKQMFGIEITEGCGMTELQIYSMNSPYGQKKIGSVGRAIAGMEISLIDDSGHLITKAGEIGELVVRGGSMTAGYWKDPELTKKNISKGWFHTNDLAYRDEEDIYWFVSRKSEIIKHQLGLVSPIEVEGVLYQHSAVLEAGVVGVSDQLGTEVAAAYVVLKPECAPVTEAQLIEFTRMRLPEFKVPDKIVFIESLPSGPTGKIDRKTLRQMMKNAGGNGSRAGVGA